jgi:hypothetical protein
VVEESVIQTLRGPSIGPDAGVICAITANSAPLASLDERIGATAPLSVSIPDQHAVRDVP